MKKNMRVMKFMVIGLIFSMSLLVPENCVAKKSKKTVHWGNAIKATLLSSSSLYAAYYYYRNVIEPHVKRLANEKGFEHAIEVSKNAVLKNPTSAVLKTVPLFLAVFHAVLARDYAKKIWKK